MAALGHNEALTLLTLLVGGQRCLLQGQAEDSMHEEVTTIC